MNVAMAIVDYIPVSIFLAASILLQRDLYNKMSKGAFALFSAGTITAFVAGLFKATWKLLYCTGICDFVALNKTFFPMQTTGFVLAAAGVLALLFHKQGENTSYSVLAATPVVYESSMLFVVFMILGVIGLDGAMIVIAKRMKKPLAIVLYVISFFFIMGMGYLSTKDFSNPIMNWAAEAVNIIGQGTFLWASILLHKAGLGARDTV